MRRASVGPRVNPVAPLSAHDEVVMRSKNLSGAPPAIRPGFMRRSCTFVTEGSWRKSSFALSFTKDSKESKESKDRTNLALQVRKKAAQLGTCEEREEDDVDSSKAGKVSKFVGNLKSWSSSEDVRHSVAGAFARTVNVIKHKPVNAKKVRQSTAPLGTPGIFTRNSDHQNTSMPGSFDTPIISNKNYKSGVRNVPLRVQRDQTQREKTLNVGSGRSNAMVNGVSSPTSSHNALHNGLHNGITSSGYGQKRTPVKVGVVKGVQRSLPMEDKLPQPSAGNTTKGRGNTPASSPKTKLHSYNKEAKDATEKKKWLRHLHEAQSAYDAREGRNRRHPHNAQEAEDAQADAIRDAEDVDGETSESADPSQVNFLGKKDPADPSLSGSANSSSNINQPSATGTTSPDSVSKKTELLRRKDLKIRQELEEKQELIADILNIPREDFESVADMAGEVGLANKEPRELVLGAIYQATRLQETLNEAQNVKDSDIIAAQACQDPSMRASCLPLHQGSVDKLLSVSGTLTQLLNSLLSLVSERDDERDRMRKELIASRERLHHLHMQKNSLECANGETSTTSGDEGATPGASAGGLGELHGSKAQSRSPRGSRPNSYTSVGSSGLEQTEGETTHTDEDCKTEELANISVIENKTVSEDTSTKPVPESEDSAVQTMTPPPASPPQERPPSVPPQEEGDGENT